MPEALEFSTPMMLQYLEIKRRYADCLLWFRLGDFYEMFLDHAEIGSRVLGITLTKRARGKDGNIPMAGIPYHAAEGYLAKLTKAGYKVAICEQMTLPQPGKALVEREVIRIITPGTTLSDLTLDQKRNNYLWVVDVNKTNLGVALVDISTGELRVGAWENQTPETTTATLQKISSLYPPSEILSNPQSNSPTITDWLASQNPRNSTQPSLWASWSKESWPTWAPSPPPTGLGALAQASPAARQVAQTCLAIIFHYLEYTQKTPPTHLQPLQSLVPAEYLVMDLSTIANLEIFSTLYTHQTQGSLVATLDMTLTSMGGRLFTQWLRKPLTNKKELEQRLDLVATLVNSSSLRSSLRDYLSHIPDIERLVARLNLGVSNPRELLTLAQALSQVVKVGEITSETKFSLHLTPAQYALATTLARLISKTIQPEPPIDPRSGGIIQPGISRALDELRAMVSDSQTYLLKLEQAERQKTGISSLKIKYNQVFGYYIEVSKANLVLVPDSYLRKQTLVNAERFITPELKVQEEIILTAEEKMNQLEYTLFKDVTTQLIAQTKPLQQIAQIIAQLDCLASLAEVATMHHYHRPEITSDGQLSLHASRHPVVEQLLPAHRFVPNDIFLDAHHHQVMLLTGPNMAGKSVLMRQVALTILMAHIGSFVPATKAKISLTDRIFVRSGASDIITQGLSTFMVEMVETAEILHHATDKSLVVMDEIGRGTSTYDGISLAWAIAEELVKPSRPHPKTLFATHYHELQALADLFPDRIHNFHLAVKEADQKLVFLYSLTEGGSPHSHGVAVAELAGLPLSVIERARNLLAQMEQQPLAQKITQKKVSQPAWSTELAHLKIDQLTPLQALNLLAQWKQKL